MGNGLDAGVDAGTPMPSMLTASGALSGTIAAPKPTVGYEATGNSATFSLRKTSGTGLAFKADLVINFTGEPAPNTYSSGTGFSCDVTLTDGVAAADTWVARRSSPAGADRGSCSLTFTSASMGAGGYVVAGSLTITAEASGGASSGMVTLMGTF